MVIVKASALVICYMAALLMMGMAVPRRMRSGSLMETVMLGFLVYFGLFELLALPLKAYKHPLHQLTYGWLGILGAVTLVVLLFKRKELWGMLCETCGKILHDRRLLCMALITAAFALFIALNVNHISDFDAGYYIGTAESSVYSDTIELMGGIQGRRLHYAQPYYMMNTANAHSAVASQIFGIPAVVEAKFSFTIILTILFMMYLYKAGSFLTHGNRFYSVFFTVAAVVVLMFSFGYANISHYFAYRTYEGKAITCYLYTTALFVMFLDIYYRRGSRWGWTGMFFAGMGGIVFSNTALFIVPMMAGSLLLGQVIRNRNIRTVAASVLALSPCAFWLLVYMKL